MLNVTYFKFNLFQPKIITPNARNFPVIFLVSFHYYYYYYTKQNISLSKKRRKHYTILYKANIFFVSSLNFFYFFFITSLPKIMCDFNACLSSPNVLLEDNESKFCSSSLVATSWYMLLQRQQQQNCYNVI